MRATDDIPDSRATKSDTDGNGEKYLDVEDRMDDPDEDAVEDTVDETESERDRARCADTARIGAVGVRGERGRATDAGRRAAGGGTLGK